MSLDIVKTKIVYNIMTANEQKPARAAEFWKID